MKQWWQWFILSGIWLLAAVLNFAEGRNFVVIGYNLFTVLLTIALGFFQRFCDKKGNAGKKLFDRIAIAAILLVLLFFVLLLILF